MPPKPFQKWGFNEVGVVCPRCKCTDQSQFRRSSLYNHSHFLPEVERGKHRAVKIEVHCLKCDYRWRSVSTHLKKVAEEVVE